MPKRGTKKLQSLARFEVNDGHLKSRNACPDWIPQPYRRQFFNNVEAFRLEYERLKEKVRGERVFSEMMEENWRRTALAQVVELDALKETLDQRNSELTALKEVHDTEVVAWKGTVDQKNAEVAALQETIDQRDTELSAMKEARDAALKEAAHSAEALQEALTKKDYGLRRKSSCRSARSVRPSERTQQPL